MWWVPTLYLAEGLPFYTVAMIAGLMYKSLGVSNEQIGHWTAALGTAWIFKPLWSPLLEVARNKKPLVVLFQAIGAGCLALMALALHVPGPIVFTVGVLGLVSIASATHDIAADGLYIASLSDKQQAAYAGWQGAFFNAAKFLSLGGLVILAGELEKRMPAASAWSVIFGVLALLMGALSLYHSAMLPRTGAPAEAGALQPVGDTLREVIVDFFRKPGIGWAILFIVLFRAGEGQIQTIGPLFLRDARSAGGLGLATDQVGLAYGTVGTAAFLVGSVLGGYFTSWLGLKRAMPWLILVLNLPNAAFCFLGTVRPESLGVISAALGVEMFGYGFGFVGVILFIMQVVAVGRFQTAHYALGTGVMQLGLVLFKSVSGDIQTALGYERFFIWVLACAVPSLVMARLLPMTPRVVPVCEAVAQPAQA
jgi:PAT family beta-lactamase induction signal transducer AmpG